MKKLTTLLLVLLSIATLQGCANKPEPITIDIPHPEGSDSNLEEASEETNPFIKTNEDETFAYYEGTTTIKGEYYERDPNTILGGILCFDANEETRKKFPVEKSWFCFDNDQEAKTMFEIDDSQLFTSLTTKCTQGSTEIRGTAEIEISGYTVNKKEAAVRNETTLRKIINKEPYSINCK